MGSWLLVLPMSQVAQKTIPQDPRDARVCRMKTLPDPALGVVGQVLGVVDPVNPVIQPKMVIGVLADSYRKTGPFKCCCAHFGKSVVWVSMGLLRSFVIYGSHFGNCVRPAGEGLPDFPGTSDGQYPQRS